VTASSTRRTNATAVTAHRGGLRRLLDLWGFVPGFAVTSESVRFATQDGVSLVADYLPGPAGERVAVPALVLAHGFAGHRRKPAYAYLAERLSEVTAVLAVDLRGHGGSAGASTFGLLEALDVTAAAAWLRRRGHRWVGVVGASMGATAALRAAAGGPPGALDAVCVISAPATWGLQPSPAMRQLTRVAMVAWYRHVYGAVTRVRIAPRAWPAQGPREPVQPVDVVGSVAPTPLLIVHGDDDHYFGPEHAQRLLAAARPPVTLWPEPAGFGHAEDGFTPAFADRLLDAVAEVCRSGVWPPACRPRAPTSAVQPRSLRSV